MKPLRALTSIMLVIAAAGASAYAYLIDRGTVSDADRSQRQRDLFPAFRVDEVARIEIEQAGERLVLERKADDRSTWLMTSPHRETADASAVDMLLRELEMAKRLRVLGAKPAGSDVALGPTRVGGRIAIGRLRYDFELEGDAPRPEGAAYLTIQGEGTFVIGRTLKVQLLRSADAYRQRMLDPYGASEIARLNVTTHDGGYTLQRHGATFRVVEAGNLRASREALEGIFGALADARADSFVEDDGGSRPDPELSVALVPDDPKRTPVRLGFGSSCPGRPDDIIVTRDGPSHVLACVPKTVERRLRSTPDALVDKNLFFAHADEIEELRLESLAGAPLSRVDLARRGSSWRQRAPAERDLTADENESANALVGDLARAQALDARPAGPQVGPPRVRATIVRTGGATTEVVEIGPRGPDGIAYARRLDDDSVLRLPRDVSRRLDPHPIALRGRSLGNIPFDASDVTAIDDSCCPTPQRLELRDGRWTMNVPAGFAVDAQAAADLADAMARAKADAWIAESDDGTFGLQAPAACTVTLVVASRQTPGSPRRVGIVFGDEHGGGYFAKTLDSPAVFVAPAALRVLASHPAIDRARLRLDTIPLTRVTLVHDGERRVIDLAARAASLIAVSTDAGHVEQLSQAVVSLYAHDALHSGAPQRGEGFDDPTLQIDAIVRADAGPVERLITIGAPTRVGPFDAYFARLAGVDATFAVPRRSVERILDAW